MAKRSEKIAIVTGGTGSLGRVVVERFLEAGTIVMITHTGNQQAIDYISSLQERGLKFEGSVVDVTSENSVNAFYNDVLDRHGRIDILCNLVGGVGQKKLIEETTFDEWNKMLLLNLHSCFLMMRGSLRSMKKNGSGRIINIASMSAVTPEAARGGYGVSKAGVIALTKTAAEEVKGFNDITVNAIAPSIIVTEENKSWGSKDEINKWVTPEQIADMIMYLCSAAGVAIHGQVIQMYGKV